MAKQNLHFIRGLYAFMLGVAFAALPIVISQGQEVTEIEPDRGGTINLETQDPAVAVERLHVAEGYEVSLFATEKEFPLANPVTMTFDARGRLWVATMPTYPQRLPGEDPDDKILILEDTDGDGRADKYTVFLDGLHLPGGMELGDGGVYIAQQPNLIFAKDTDGDDVADVIEVILHGFGTEDSHHSISAFTWGPGGGLYFQEGTFHHSQVETPYGPVRLVNAGVFRYKPRTFRLEVFVTYPFANPWGHIFDRWGQNFLADASGGANYFGSAIAGNAYYPDKRRSMKVFTTIVRPTAGCEIVSSRHFPDEAQGNFLVNNTIGFQGIKQHRMIEEDSGFTSEEIEPLIYSEDINFRPVDLQFGPDGALYVVDWFNPLVGHMQYSLRHPDRDHGHGRIWRITYKGRPLLTPPKIDGASIPELLENLKAYEDRTRYRTRIELRSRDWNEVAAALETWVPGLDKNDPQYEHHLLEALWVHQTINVFNQPLLERMLQSPEPRARAAATRVLRYWRDRVTGPLAWLEKQTNDPHPRVRLEAVLALSFFPDDAAASIALQTLQHPLDYYLEYVLRETITTLRPQWKPKLSEDRFRAVNQSEAERYLVESIPTGELKQFTGSEVVYRALLERRGLDDVSRGEALSGLAHFSGTDPIAELLDAMESLDNAVPWADRKLLSDLSRLLLQQGPRELAEHRVALAASAQTAMNPETRAGAYAALLSIDKSGDAAWELALEQTHLFADVVRAIPITPNSSIREGLYPRITKLLSDPPRELRSLKRGIPARYVRIELPGRRKELSVAEVEVFRKDKNLALKGAASQSSTSEERDASRAIDGQSQTGAPTQTRGQSNPWFEIDLGREETIDAITIWRSRGDRYRERLDGFTLKVLDANRRVVFVRDALPAPDRSLDLDIAQGMQQDLTKAAIEALASMDVEAEARFALLSALIEEGREVETAAAALGQIPEHAWPSNEVAPVAEDLLAYVQGVSADRLSSEEVQAVFAAGDRLARSLPESQSSVLRAALADAGVTVVTIRPIPHLMLFEQTEFTVKSGRPVEIVFENIDVMPHNVVVTAPGRMEVVGRAADAMQTDADAQERHYVPDLEDVLYATRLVKPGERQRLAFLAPQEPGDYPYVCTYPGHWITMYGVMHVVDELDASMLAEETQPIAPRSELRQVVRYWELDDLKPDLPQARIGRSFAAGKELFSVAGCVQCHQMRSEGRSIGPDLTEIGEKYNALGVLEHILDPSLEVAKEYQGYIVQTKDEFYAGPIVNQDNATVRIRANSLEPDEVTEILRSDIVLMEPSSLSTMPTDLLITLQKEEILDLLAFLLSGGNEEHAAFAN